MHKFFPATVKSFDDEKMILEHFISTEHRDRSGDIVRASGMKLDGIPSVLKNHGFDDDTGHEPIARCLSIVPGINSEGIPGIICKTQYYDGAHLVPPDNTGRRLYEKGKNEFMPWWSIGFEIEKSIPLTDGAGGRDIQMWWCYEYSQVGVPDNITAETVKSFKPEDAKPEDTIDFALEEIPEGYKTLEDFYTKSEICECPPLEMKPYKNEHACRIKEPIAGAKTRRVNGDRTHDGKKYDVIYQKTNTKWHVQAFRYPKKTWTAASAKAHCKSHNGIRFEAAKKEEKFVGVPIESYKFLETLGLPSEEGSQIEIGGIEAEVLRTEDSEACVLVVPSGKAAEMNAIAGALNLCMKTMAERLAGRVPLEALYIVFDIFLYELLYHVGTPREMKALVQEYAKIVERYAAEWWEEMHSEDKSVKDEIWRKARAFRIPDDDGTSQSVPDGATGDPAPAASPSPQTATQKSPVLFRIKQEARPATLKVGMSEDQIAQLVQKIAGKALSDNIAELRGRVTPQQ